MSRSVLALALTATVLLPRVAGADDDDLAPKYMCKTPPASMKVSVQFSPEVSLHDLTAWVIGFTCKNVVFGADVAKYATKIVVVAPNAMTPKQALQLFVDAVESTGLVVVQKPDTLVIKLGPNMPKGCPDASPVARDPLATQERTPVPPPPPEPELTDAELDAGIKVIDENHRQLSRAFVERLFASPMALARSMRIVPALRDGKPVGFKLFAIRAGSVFARLGFLNGDTMVRINGLELTSPDKALEVYAKLRTATSIQIELERRGKPSSLLLTVK
jgi:membrane-associated protease RseP (regulator of RpoE activity)